MHDRRPDARAERRRAREAPRTTRPVLVYLVLSVLGVAAFLYPFWLPSEALPNQAHTGDAPIVAALVGVLVVVALALEVRNGTMNAITVALLGVLSAASGLMRLLDLPGGGSGLFFLVVLAAAAFGPQFGLLLGLCSMAVAALVTGGVGPWLPYQMLALAWMAAGAGAVGRLTVRLRPRQELAALAAYGWVWGFLYGAIMNLWFWPFAIGSGSLSWNPELGFTETLQHYWSFYVVTSFAWDAAGATANAVLIWITGLSLLTTMRRYAGRLDPVVEFLPDTTGAASPSAGARAGAGGPGGGARPGPEPKRSG